MARHLHDPRSAAARARPARAAPPASRSPVSSTAPPPRPDTQHAFAAGQQLEAHAVPLPARRRRGRREFRRQRAAACPASSLPAGSAASSAEPRRRDRASSAAAAPGPRAPRCSARSAGSTLRSVTRATAAPAFAQVEQQRVPRGAHEHGLAATGIEQREPQLARRGPRRRREQQRQQRAGRCTRSDGRHGSRAPGSAAAASPYHHSGGDSCHSAPSRSAMTCSAGQIASRMRAASVNSRRPAAGPAAPARAPRQDQRHQQRS